MAKQKFTVAENHNIRLEGKPVPAGSTIGLDVQVPAEAQLLRDLLASGRIVETDAAQKALDQPANVAEASVSVSAPVQASAPPPPLPKE